jgi:hypothetical protein
VIFGKGEGQDKGYYGKYLRWVIREYNSLHTKKNTFGLDNPLVLFRNITKNRAGYNDIVVPLTTGLIYSSGMSLNKMVLKIMMDKNQELENLILSTLSFYEPMSFSKIVFDIDTETLKSYPNFDKDQMLLILKSLEKRGLVKMTGKDIEAQWQRVHKKRSIWRRFF